MHGAPTVGVPTGGGRHGGGGGGVGGDGRYHGAREDAVAASNCERVRSAHAPPSTHNFTIPATHDALHVALLNCGRCTSRC